MEVFENYFKVFLWIFIYIDGWLHCKPYVYTVESKAYNTGPYGLRVKFWTLTDLDMTYRTTSFSITRIILDFWTNWPAMVIFCNSIDCKYIWHDAEEFFEALWWTDTTRLLWEQTNYWRFHTNLVLLSQRTWWFRRFFSFYHAVIETL